MDKETEYTVQMFGFTANAFSDSVYNVMSDSVDAVIEDLYRDLKARSLESQGPQSTTASTDDDPVGDVKIGLMPANDGLLKELRRSCDSFRNDLLSSAGVVCDKLEVFLMKNVFVVPEHVTLPEDRVQLLEDKRQLRSPSSVDAEQEKLKNELKMEATKIAELELDKNLLDSTIKAYESRLSVLDQVLEEVTQHGSVDLKMAVMESVNAVKDLIVDSATGGK